MRSSIASPRSARKERAFPTLLSFAFAALVVVPGCGADSKGATNGTGLHTSGDEGRGAGGADASGDEGTGGGGADAGICNDLENTAAATFATFVDQHAICATDTDCTLVHFTESSFCASPCPVVMNQAGAGSAVSVASQDCASFNALGCAPPEVGCPGFGSPICAAGTCAQYTLWLTESGDFAHGSCTALTETYEQSWEESPAPRDFPLTVTATDGTLYADATCTTPLSSSTITIPKGASSTTFGFVPTAAGPFAVNLDDGSGNPGAVSGIAQ